MQIEFNGTYDYVVSFQFEFPLNGGYNLQTKNINNLIKLNYSQQLRDDEFMELLRAEAKLHKEFIEERLRA